MRRAVSALLLVALAAAGAASAALLAHAPGALTVTPPASSGLCVTTTAPQLSTTGSGAEVSAGAQMASVSVTSGEGTSPAPVDAASTPPQPAGATTATSAAPGGCGGSTAPTEPTAPSATGSTSLPPATAPATPSSTLVLTGHGWGHGMGMSQWGAYGYSEHGWDAAQILDHYYPGTTLGTQSTPIVRVLLSGPDVRVRLGSDSPWRVADARGTVLALAAGSFVLPASLRVEGRRLVSPLRFTPGASPVEVSGRPYRGGLLVVSAGATLQVVNTVSMGSYLDGVVGEEMPSSWPPAALEAQAVAARSYALFQLEDAVSANPFALYGDARSQVYGGIDGESPAVSAAVRATAHEVVLYDGKVAMTEYSSSSGGQTVSAAEAVGTTVPYLVSVPDPYDTLSPYHDWGPILISAAVAGSALGLDGPLVGLQTVRGPSRHVESATAVGPTSRLTLSGTQVEADLGLPSTWFEVGWLSLTPPATPVRFGGATALEGVARGLVAVSLEAKVAGADWRPLGAVIPAPDGAFSVIVSPRATTSYRLAAGTIRAAEITVAVSASVSAALDPGGVRGTVTPVIPGEPVTLERQRGARWAAVARATTGAGGAFAIDAPLAPGTYRVGCSPDASVAAGYSSLLAEP